MVPRGAGISRSNSCRLRASRTYSWWCRTCNEKSFAKMAAPQTRSSAARIVRRRSIIETESQNCLLHHGHSSIRFPLQVHDLPGSRRDEVLPLRQLLQPAGAEKFGLLQLQHAPLAEQPPLFGAQRFQLVAGQRAGYARSQYARQQRERYTGCSNGGPARAACLRIGLAHQARVVDLFRIQEYVFVRQRPQQEWVPLRPHWTQ